MLRWRNESTRPAAPARSAVRAARSRSPASGEHAIRLALTQPDRFPPERFAGFAADLLAIIAKALGR